MVGDDNNSTVTEYFAKQIAVESAYILSVSPTSVREDDDPTNIAVKVRVCDTCDEVEENTPVSLQLGTNQTGKDRFSIDAYPTLTIPRGQKEATGTIRFTPDESSTTPDDDLLVTLRTDTEEVDGSADIRLVDADKESYYVNLSFSTAELNKRDPETAIEVTATLDGKPLSENLSFVLTIDKDYETANSAIAAKRDSHYTARMATITIRRNRVSGRATININPINIEKETRTRPFRVIASNLNSQVTVDGRPITVNGALFDITGDPGSAVTGLRATPFSIREDAVTKEVTLEVTLQNALATDERVQFSFEDGIIDADLRARLSEDFDDADPAERDTHYDVRVEPLTIAKGDTKGTTTMTVTVSNDTDTNDSRAFTVTATVGGVPYSTGILITDDDAASGLISLEASPAEISEDAGQTTVTVTATLHGKEFDDDIVVPLVIDATPMDLDDAGDPVAVEAKYVATRDHDFHASLNALTIPAGSIQGTTTITITPVANDGKEEDEKIRLKSLAGLEAEDEDGIDVPLTINSVDITLKDTADAADDGDDPSQPAPADPTRPAFAADAEIADQVYTVGTAIDPLVLPEAAGDDTPFMYNVFSLGLPAGLSFDPATRTLSGTPTAATDGPVSVIYTVVDSDGDAGVPLTFSITVNAAEAAPPTADAEIMATPSLIREDAGQTQVMLTVSLMDAKDTDERVTFTIVAPSQGTEGKPAVRDVDYDATLGAVVTIPSGETVGTSTLTLTPRDNSRVDGLRAIGVQATFSSGATISTDIEISDDETSSTSIALSVSPHKVSEDAGTTDVSVTATLDGQALAAAATVSLSINNASTAQRDVDYTVEFTPLIEIPAGSTIGVTLLTLRPIDDDIVEGDEIIKLTGTIAGLVGDEAELLLSDSDQAVAPDAPDAPDAPGDGSLAFAAGAMVADQTYTAGTAIDALMLPEASGGTGALTYSLVGLPAGLSFDGATRLLSGTPTAATNGAVAVTYIVVDESGKAAVLIFSITVNTGMSTSFGFAGAVVPDQRYTAGAAIKPLVLPAASGGTGALTYRLVGLPAGLSFDAATRTIAGTPTAATGGAVEVTYIATDEGGKAALLTFNITVNPGLSFGGLGFGKIVPTASHDLAKIREFVVGQRVEDFALPEASGGTAPLTYTLSPALPAGLTFDAATRTIAGTPRAEGETAYTYTVTDANGASTSLSLQTLPAAFSLADNFPNPFNPATTIQYALPQAADVELTVYNVLGQPVRTLVAEHQSAGRYAVEWDATNDSGHSLSAGMYFYRLQAGGEFHEVKKMLLLK
ncbi:MAG: putative Ig domain-containing protein [Gemmatimonadota bacterium]|nr:putative Ig domain-containing protein [Gemmatimonadota bacterium]